MKIQHLNISKEDFEKPENPISIRLDCADKDPLKEKEDEKPVIKKGDIDF